MSTAVMTSRLDLSSAADSALRAATRFWFAVTVMGQLLFAFAVASFYGHVSAQGNWLGWNRFMSHGYAPGEHLGNTAAVMHVLSAVVVMLSGAVQLIPQVRNRFPVFHRWNGRLYLLVGVTVSAAGLYLMWIRGTVGDLSQHLGSTGNALLIWLCAAQALRYALARDFRTHRRWALRLFLVTSASWFFRVEFFLSFLIFRGPYGFDPITMTGPLVTFLSFGQYLVPLAILELYLYARDRASSAGRFAMASALVVVTLGMAAGILGFTFASSLPEVKAVYASRRSIADTLSATIVSSGIDRAARQYHDLKSSQPAAYNFDEAELNNLGYELIHAHKIEDAVRILQLNVEAYPQSANTYDSLGEAYMDGDNKQLAIANYQKALQLNPRSQNAMRMLQKLNAR